MTERPVRVVVCDESAAAARLQRLLEHDGTIDVVATRRDAEQALAVVPELRPDVVTISADLPPYGGIETVEQLMASSPVPIVVLGDGDATAVLAAGALAAYSRDVLPLALDDPAASAFRRHVRRLAAAPVIRHPRARLRLPRQRDGVRPRPIEAIGVVASTGGPPALRRVLASLPAAFPVPILVVQHMSTGFTQPFSDWLGAAGGPPVRLADRGRPLLPGVWIAPEDAHLSVVDGSLALDTATPAVHRPSGDVLFASLAEAYGAACAAVVLSGMGTDGARGVRCVRDAGGVAIAQDEATSAIFGMPRAAAAAGADVVLPLDRIATALVELAGMQP